jgi:hypothetical protein
MVGEVFGSLFREHYVLVDDAPYVTVEQLDEDLGDCRFAIALR